MLYCLCHVGSSLVSNASAFAVHTVRQTDGIMTVTFELCHFSHMAFRGAIFPPV